MSEQIRGISNQAEKDADKMKDILSVFENLAKAVAANQIDANAANADRFEILVANLAQFSQELVRWRLQETTGLNTLFSAQAKQDAKIEALSSSVKKLSNQPLLYLDEAVCPPDQQPTDSNPCASPNPDPVVPNDNADNQEPAAIVAMPSRDGAVAPIQGLLSDIVSGRATNNTVNVIIAAGGANFGTQNINTNPEELNRLKERVDKIDQKLDECLPVDVLVSDILSGRSTNNTVNLTYVAPAPGAIGIQNINTNPEELNRLKERVDKIDQKLDECLKHVLELVQSLRETKTL